MAGATGAAIVGDGGNNLRWRDRCDSCGYVSSCIQHASHPSPGVRIHCGSYRCERCGQLSEITIYG